MRIYSDSIAAARYDRIEPFVLNALPGFTYGPIGVVDAFFPARSAQLELRPSV